MASAARTAAGSVAWTIAGAILLGGCQAIAPQGSGSEDSSSKDSGAQPFVFSDLNLRQRDREGRPLWSISSPETRYDISRRLAQARELTGVIYRGGEPFYRLSASNAVVVNDGEVVLLEGPTRVERTDGEEPAVVTAQRVRWYPAQERMEIDRDPRGIQGDLELTAGLARFLIDADRLELRRQPVLRQRGEEPVRLELGQVDWQPGTGALVARGPVRGFRRLRNGPEQRLTAPALTGNTLSQTIDLQAPVQIDDPSRNGTLTAGATQLNLEERTARSSAPFRGRLGESRLRGIGFAIDGQATTVLVPAGCELEQPGESLRAQRCLWNWTAETVDASGAVVLRREANGLETRASQLQGNVGADGRVEFSTPGGRVESQLRLPPGREPAAGGGGDRGGGGGGVRTDRPPAFQL